MDKKIGFIGLGQMGKWMAVNVLKAGFDLSVFDLSSDAIKFLTDNGAKAAPSCEYLASKMDWIFLSLPNTDIIESVLFGKDGLIKGARKGLTIVDCGTTSYLPTLDFERRLKERQIVFADAPVSGMEARAKEGKLTIMFGGERAVFDKIFHVLEVIGNKILYMGGIGNGQLTKLINQLLFNINCAAIAEILPMATKLGLDPEKITEVVTTGTGRSFAAEFFTPHILEESFDHGYPLENAYKDMISAAELSAHSRIPLPLTQAAACTYQMALAEGYGKEDKGAMIKVFERLLGVKFRKR